MRFMYLVRSSHQGPPPPRLMEEMAKLSERKIKEGSMIDSGGLLPMAMGARISLSGGAVEVTDGPFVEAKELVGGYAIFDYKTREEAIASAVEFIEVHKRFWEGWEGECEMRLLATAPPCA